MAFFYFISLAIIYLFLPSTAFTSELYPGTTSVFLPYANARNNHDLTRSPKIHMGFNGNHRIHEFVMDTGSVGIIASADYFQPAPGAVNLGPGEQYYSSSGIIERGTWWTATQQFYNENGQLIATASVPVLQVTSIICAEHARACRRPRKRPKGIAMMGVGFARKSSQQPRGTSDYNAFLNIQSIHHNGILKPLPQDWVNGYVVKRNGVELGLTATNTAQAALIKLMPWKQNIATRLPEWMPAPMTIVVNGVSENGHILLDTGVGDAYLTPPATAYLGPLIECTRGSRPECAPKGTVVSIYLPSQSNPLAHYTFTVGQRENPMQPRNVHVVKKSSLPFLNTSRHILGGMDFLYDNTNGYVGYIWNGHANDLVGGVIPTPK